MPQDWIKSPRESVFWAVMQILSQSALFPTIYTMILKMNVFLILSIPVLKQKHSSIWFLSFSKLPNSICPLKCNSNICCCIILAWAPNPRIKHYFLWMYLARTSSLPHFSTWPCRGFWHCLLSPNTLDCRSTGSVSFSWSRWSGVPRT